MPEFRPTAADNASGSAASMWTVVRRSRPFLLLMALALNLVLVPVVSGPWLRMAIQTAIMLAAASLASDTPGHRRVTAWLILPALVLNVTGILTGNLTVEWISYPFILGYFIHVIRLMLHRIFTAPEITLDEIGLAMCTYVLLGQLWVLFYVPVVTIAPGAITFGGALDEEAMRSALVYFSYVTLTTLGYGDIQPVSPLARSLAVVESLTGVLFLAVLISRLVGTYRSNRESG